MGTRFTEALYHLSQHKPKTEEIEEQLARLEETFKDELTSAVMRSYAQMVATLTPEINRVRKIQDHSATKICTLRSKVGMARWTGCKRYCT